MAANVYTVAKAIEQHAETRGATMVRCDWMPRYVYDIPGHYQLTMTVTNDEVWKTSIFPSTGRVICQKYRNECPVHYEMLECTPLYEMRGIQQFPHGYMLHLIRTYAKGYPRV